MIPLVDLKTQYEQHKEEFQSAINQVLSTTAFVLGKEVEAFEKNFAAFVGTAYAVGVASGTDALHLALRAVGIGPGDEVITVTNSFLLRLRGLRLPVRSRCWLIAIRTPVCLTWKLRHGQSTPKRCPSKLKTPPMSITCLSYRLTGTGTALWSRWQHRVFSAAFTTQTHSPAGSLLCAGL